MKFTRNDLVYLASKFPHIFIQSCEDRNKFYMETDGIRVIIEDGKATGWYKP